MRFSGEMIKLYAITDCGGHDLEKLLWQVEQSLKGGVTMLQLRDKTANDRELLQEALALKKLCGSYGVPLIVNDHVELARRVDADGVHVGQTDMELSRARAILGPDKIIGVTAKTAEQALAAQNGGADYLGSGAMFPSESKSDAKAMTRETLQSICEAVNIPVAAIGGIRKDNILQLSGTGISGVAVIQGIFGQPDVRAAARELGRCMDQIRSS